MVTAQAPESLLTQAQQVSEVSEFEKLLQKPFAAKGGSSKELKPEIKSAICALAEEALQTSTVMGDDVIEYIESLIAAIDEKMSSQMNEILHHEDFKRLEGSWRGLHHLVDNTETGEQIKIRVMNVKKQELWRSLKRYKGTKWDQSPIFKKVYEEEFGTPGGEPYGCLIGDYEFDHSPPDIDLLRNLSKVAAASHCPFLSAAAPSLLNMDSWQELSNPRDLAKIFSTPQYAGWRSLRESEDSRYIGLTMPRFLSRVPYGSKTNPVEDFAFEENTSTADHSNYVWSNAAYAMGVNLTRAFRDYGWCARIRGRENGGLVDNLPVHTFPTDDGGVDVKCPTEISITDRREAELTNVGLMPLSHWKNTDFAAFVGAQSLNKPPIYEGEDGDEATANAKLASRLPYLFFDVSFCSLLKVHCEG